MKTHFHLLSIFIAACVLSGCGDSKSTPQSTQSAEQSSPSTAVAPATGAVKPAVEAGKAAVSDLTSQFAKLAAAQSDKLLVSVGGDLVDKVKSLGQSLGANAAVKSQLDSTLQSLLGGQDSEALTMAFQVVQAANLTPPQLQLAKEVGNLASAYVVQKNFAALDGAKGDVATIVNSLRKGEITSAIPAIQKVAQNANLTAPQKQLISSLADKYAPGIKKAADSLQQGLQVLPGVKK
jgi:hypothetical protein